jgi:tetratricopeptide (TPR) repeat protein
MDVAVLALTLLAARPARAASDDWSAVKADAVIAYDNGDYGAARTMLQQLDAVHALDGPLLYRLFFCEKAAGKSEDARKALERSRDALETESAASGGLETSFYLANAYANLGKPEDAKRAAREMTAKIESGKVAKPTTAMGYFQLGKLYQDQARQSDATTWYTKAVDAFDVSKGRYVGNVRWALRYLGNASFARQEFAASESALARLTDLGGAEANDWDALAAARARQGNYAGAATAWRTAVKLDPGNTDDAHYGAQLAEAAARLVPLPSKTPEGKEWGAMSQSVLEAFMKTQAAAEAELQGKVGAAMQPSADGTPTKPMDVKGRKEIAASMISTRRLFVTAGLEYTLRHYGIRETAFKEGYAVLIFQERAWEIPPDPPPAAKKAS